MHLKKTCQLLFILALISCQTILAQPATVPQTFCNPLNLNYRFMADAIDAREAADPVIVLFKDDYYLFASRSGGYWTSPDLRTWTFIVPQGIDIESYAPAVISMRDSLFYIPGGTTQVYKTGDPKSGIWEKGPSLVNYGDPALFLDDDGKLYLSYGVSNTAPTSIVELDPVTFKQIGSKVDVVLAQASIHGWERRGDDNLLDEQPWIEGTWLVKSNNKYYMHYSGPGTEFKTYADGIYVADSPLGPYEYAPYSPFIFKPTGFITGTGHGCTFKDKNGLYWHIGTMTISVKHMFERRLGLFPVAFDDDGEIYSNTNWGDYPQYFPGVQVKPVENNFPGMMVLSHKKFVMASSSLEDHGIENAVDEDVRTYWSAQSGDPDEWIMVDLGKDCSVEAIQVNFAEHNTNPDIVRGRDNLIYEQYILETSTDGMNWAMLVDKSSNMEDVPHDYVELSEPVTSRYIKLTNKYTPGGGNFAIRDLRIFGNKNQTVFTTVSDFTVDRIPLDGRDAVVSWSSVENADGYVVTYGIAPDKLYNNYMVYDADSIAIHSLNQGVEYFYHVQAFDNGTDYYKPVGEIHSYQSGNWDDLNSWAQYDGTNWVNPVSNIPSFSNKPVKILNGHTITVTANDSISQLIVANGASLVINKDIDLYVKNGIETDLMVEGTLKNYGTITKDPLSTISFAGNGTYEHKLDGSSIPEAIWRAKSSISLDSIKANLPSNFNQNFYNLIWNCPDQTSDLSLQWNGNTIGGNVTIHATGAGVLQMCNPTEGENAVVNINGDVIQDGGQFTAIGSDAPNTDVTVNQNGNLDITGGNFSVSMGTQGGSGTTRWNLFGNISMAGATTQNSNPGGATFVIKKEGGIQLLSLTGVDYASGGFPVEVDSGATLDMGKGSIEGDGSFNLKAGATLMTAHQNGIEGSIATNGSKTFSKGSNYWFKATTPQFTGSSMPDTVNNLTINNPLGVKLSGSSLVNGTLDLKYGALTLNGNTLSYGPNGYLKYSGLIAQTATNAEFPSIGGPSNLIVANSKGITLHASRIINDLDLGYKLSLGSNNLTVSSISNIRSNAFIVTIDGGSLTRTSVDASQALYPIGASYYSPVWISNFGVVDDISVGVIKDLDESPYGARIKLKWNIDESTPGGGNYNIQFGWMSASESTTYKSNRENNSKIFNLTDTTEAGSGSYSTQFAKPPYSVSRGGISNLGPFVVGIFGFPTSAELIQNNNELSLYPNPFDKFLYLEIPVENPGKLTIKVYDTKGRICMVEKRQLQYSGVQQLEINTAKLSKGIYLYRVELEGKNYTGKIVKE
jgi:xylan 1,4-beta-xylosidase